MALKSKIRIGNFYQKKPMRWNRKISFGTIPALNNILQSHPQKFFGASTQHCTYKRLYHSP